jgi:hypothetical protein
MASRVRPFWFTRSKSSCRRRLSGYLDNSDIALEKIVDDPVDLDALFFRLG